MLRVFVVFCLLLLFLLLMLFVSSGGYLVLSFVVLKFVCVGDTDSTRTTLDLFVPFSERSQTTMIPPT